MKLTSNFKEEYFSLFSLFLSCFSESMEEQKAMNGFKIINIIAKDRFKNTGMEFFVIVEKGDQ